MRHIRWAVLIYALLSGVAPAHVSLPWPGPGRVAGAATSCAGANNEFTDYSNSCNLIYMMVTFR